MLLEQYVLGLNSKHLHIHGRNKMSKNNEIQRRSEHKIAFPAKCRNALTTFLHCESLKTKCWVPWTPPPHMHLSVKFTTEGEEDTTPAFLEYAVIQPDGNLKIKIKN